LFADLSLKILQEKDYKIYPASASHFVFCKSELIYLNIRLKGLQSYKRK